MTTISTNATGDGRGAAPEGGPRRVLGEVLLLLATACILTAGSWALRSDRLPLRATPDFYELDLEAPLVSITDALVLYDEGEHLFVDTRPGDGPRPSIPGSFVIRAESFVDDLDAVSDFLSEADPLILYSDGNLAGASDAAAHFLEYGYEQLLILDGGLRAWSGAGGALRGREAGDE